MRIPGTKILAVAALLAPVAAASAQAPEWRLASSDGDNQAFIDTASIRRDGDKVRFWREIRTPEPVTLEGGLRFDRLGSLGEVDCRARTRRTLELYAKLDGEEIARGEDTGEVEPIVPASTGETEMRAVCLGEWVR